MNFSVNPTPKRRKQDHGGHLSVILDNFGENDDDLTFYSYPPMGKIDLFEVDKMVNERLSILEVFEELKMSESGQVKNLPDHLGTITERLKRVNVDCGDGDNFITTLHARVMGKSNVLKKDARRRDQISHFLLRLYFCTPHEKKTWFISRETELLRYRLLQETVVNNSSIIVAKLIADNGLNFESITLRDTQTDRNLRENASFSRPGPPSEDKSPIYRIAFEDALDVVRLRKAYLQGGYAYVTSHDMITLICSKFRTELNIALARLVAVRPDEENRLVPLINNVYLKKISSVRKIKADSSGRVKEVITPAMVDSLATENFPPCMESIHLALRKNHHLKYNGRLHYGLFLKAIGLSLEDAIKFFRDEFIKNTATTPEKFDKEYRYGIRYNYGKEGKKVDFSPYGCEKIINSSPGTGDVHGCPFKHHDLTNVKRFLARKGISDETLETIETLVNEKSYTRACTIYFNVRHPGHRLNDESITHPNSFYTESRKALTKNPRREEVMVDQDIDHFVLPMETTILTQETTSSQNDDDDDDDDDDDEPAAEPMDEEVEPNVATSVEVDEDRPEETVTSETIIKILNDDEPKENAGEIQDEPEQ